MMDDHKQRAATWRARMIAAMSNLDLAVSPAQYGDRLGDAAEALAELDSVRTIYAWAEHHAEMATGVIAHNQRREIHTLEAILMALGSKGAPDDPDLELERVRFMADIAERLAKLRAQALHAGMTFAVQLLGETRAYFAQIAASRSNDVLSILVHACMVGEMRKDVAEDLAAEDTAGEDDRPSVEAMFDEWTRCASEVKS